MAPSVGWLSPECLFRVVQMTTGSAMEAERISEITCPHCGHRKREEMPLGACQFFYECEGCGTVLRPKPGDCCVYCSYGSVPCPPRQGQADRACPS
jgi:hypothetical protein